MATDTKQALLDAAERLFAERGFAATSMRDIAARAKANLAAANYHFGGKRGLMEAVLERRVTPLNRSRLEALDGVEAARGRSRVALEALLEAFIGPALRMAEHIPGGGAAFVQLMGRTFIEPDERLQSYFMGLFKEVANRFIPAFQQAVPELPATDLFWRMHFMIGCLAHTMGDKERLRVISRGQVNPDDTEAAIRELVRFVAGGLRAPGESGKHARPHLLRHETTPAPAAGGGGCSGRLEIHGGAGTSR
jgi:AcrR family transcriptional regulator